MGRIYPILRGFASLKRTPPTESMMGRTRMLPNVLLLPRNPASNHIRSCNLKFRKSSHALLWIKNAGSCHMKSAPKLGELLFLSSPQSQGVATCALAAQKQKIHSELGFCFLRNNDEFLHVSSARNTAPQRGHVALTAKDC